MLYGTPQSGFNPAPDAGLNLTCLVPGDHLTLFDGTETPVQGIKSVAFSRGYSPGASDNGTTFTVYGMPSTATIDVQVSNDDVDGHYVTVNTISPDANGNGFYTDIGRAAFYRVTLSAYASGAMPVVKVKR